MDRGGEWKHEIWTNLRAERRIRLQLQGARARPWLLERRNGIARGMDNRLVGGGRFSGKRILSEVQWCLGTLIFAGGFPAK